MDRAIHHASTPKSGRGTPDVSAHDGSGTNAASSGNSAVPAPRTLDRAQIENPCGILERIIQTITDTINKTAGTAFRRYQIIGSVTALCKDPGKWFNDPKNAKELNFRMQNFSDVSTLAPELEKIASSYASIPLIETLFPRPKDASVARPNPATDSNVAVEGDANVGINNDSNVSMRDDANVGVDADIESSIPDVLLGELKKAFQKALTQESGLQKTVDRIFENVFPGFTNAVNLDSKNLIASFVRVWGVQTLKAKLFCLEFELTNFLKFFDEKDRSAVANNLTEIVTGKFIGGPKNISESLIKYKAEMMENISRHSKRDILTPEQKVLYKAVESAIAAIEKSKSEKQRQDVFQPRTQKVISASSKKLTSTAGRAHRLVLPEKVAINTTHLISPPEEKTLTLDGLIKSQIKPAIADLAFDAMTFEQELQLANNFFRAIELVANKCIEEKWALNADFIRKIFDGRLGGSKKRISAFAFHMAAKTYCEEKRATTVNRTALVKPFIESDVFPKTDSPEDGLSPLVDRYFNNAWNALEKQSDSNEDNEDYEDVAQLLERKLIRSLKILKERLDGTERQCLVELVKNKADDERNKEKFSKEEILDALKLTTHKEEENGAELHHFPA